MSVTMKRVMLRIEFPSTSSCRIVSRRSTLITLDMIGSHSLGTVARMTLRLPSVLGNDPGAND